MADLNFEHLKIFFDGGSRGNPGPSAVGAVIYDRNDNLVEELSEFIGEKTNNQAEYMAIDAALEIARKYRAKYNIRRIIINTDSKLVHCQLKGIWKIKDEEIRGLASKVLRKLREYELVDLRLIPREENRNADRLVNKAIDEKLHGIPGNGKFPGINGTANGVRFGQIEE